MKKKSAPKNSKNNTRKANIARPAKKAPAFGKRPKAKIPALGSGMMGLGGTGAQGMMP